MLQPGAAILTQSPWFDQLYSPSLSVVAATLRTSGYAAGYIGVDVPLFPAAATRTAPFEAA